MNGTNSANDRSTEDEHQRFARYLDELAVVRDEDEAELVTRILRDPDTTMAQSAIVRHLDRRAAQLLTDDGFTSWAHAMAEVSAERVFLPHRLHEWRAAVNHHGRAVELGGSHHGIRLVPAQGRRDPALTRRPHPARRVRKNPARPC
ncbi:hypothetical protein OHB41_43210 [Streptomyces sp. NBC_01571]|uniref:hypothetical protein n=1 Tax=Streptomyces sp. NBC_01571 TaxID=2975883 RepID=UPI002252B352|nr:hypothetical protein [Streptomyces sp. NBC_01571]MCX4579866.1 hypothetical protein [Streptomyces sp. NBC_01571]